MKKAISLLLGIVLITSIIFLSACGEKKSGEKKSITDTHMPEEKSTEELITEQTVPDPETDSPSDSQENSGEVLKIQPESPDEVLKIMEMPFEDGKTLTLFVIGKKAEGDIGLYGVREVRVYEGENLLQSILVKEAIDIDGVDGIDEGYTSCFSKVDSAALKDVNFDGYLDLEVCGWTPNNSIPYYYWCWNNDTQQFEYGFCLQLTGIDEENKLLIASYKVENGLYYTDYYRVNEKKQAGAGKKRDRRSQTKLK
ncbi:MAG TPA: hypothetical protein GXX36_15550 [Clostridiaceae bacterium]|nr:hypothetical protein [Clostridiaceae bacterium]